MSALGYLILSIAKISRLLINLYTFVVAAAVIISWVNADPYNPIVRVLNQLTAPAFRLARRIMPSILFRTGLDLSPILIFILLILVDTVAVSLLFDLAEQLLR